MILITIALRNLREHRGKTLVIGTLIALGITLMVIGNSVTETITDGMRASYIENFTGDLIVRNVSADEVSFLPGPGGVAPPPRLEDFDAVLAALAADSDVTAVTPLLSGIASVGQGDESLGFAVLWGIEPSSYRTVFPDSFVVEEGRHLEDGERGLLLSRSVVDDIADETGVRLEPGQTVLLSAQNDVTGFKIQEVPIVGIGAFANSAGTVDAVSLVDVVTQRTLLGLTDVPLERAPDAGSASAAPDESVSEASLFGGALVEDAAPAGDGAGDAAATELDYENILGDTSVRERYLALDNRAWHYLLVRVDEGAVAEDVRARLESDSGLNELVVEDWRWGAGFVADIAFSIRTILNIAIAVVAIVAVIVITNTLVISVTERIGEIGTIRALGGQRGFVRALITTEVLTIVGIFGVVGIALGSAVIGLLNVIGIPATNLFLQVLFGGGVLEPTLSLGALASSVLVVAAIGVIASLYPASVALGIPPVQAMQKR